MAYLELGDITTYHRQEGAGPDVVLIHAFTSNSAIWMFTGLVEALAGEFRVTMYDLRGHGKTTVTPAGYGSDRLADDYLRLHAALGLGPACLVGHSYGGVIATHAALLAPERVRGVILSDSYFPGLRDLEPHMGQADVWRSLRQNFAQVGEEIGERVDFERLFRVVAGLAPDKSAALKQVLGAPGARWLGHMGQLAATAAGREAFETAGLTRERLRELQTPVLALYDEHSPFAATCRFLVEHLPNCRADVVPGANHLAPLQSPAEFTAKVLAQVRAWRDGAA